MAPRRTADPSAAPDEQAAARPPGIEALEARIVGLIGVAQDCASACQEASRQLRAALETHAVALADPMRQLEALRAQLDAVAAAVHDGNARGDHVAAAGPASSTEQLGRLDAACTVLERSLAVVGRRGRRAAWVEGALFTLLGASLGVAAMLWGVQAQLDRTEALAAAAAAARAPAAATARPAVPGARPTSSNSGRGP